MLAAERQNRILVEVQRRGAVRVSELSELFDVSDMTIRRDLDALASQGQLDKVHGGATTRRSLSTPVSGGVPPVLRLVRQPASCRLRPVPTDTPAKPRATTGP